jgi:hypothetical protein
MTFKEQRIDELDYEDLVDLENDPFADPEKNNPLYEFEYMTVDRIEKETDQVMIVYFYNGPTIAFPKDHIVKIKVGR